MTLYSSVVADVSDFFTLALRLMKHSDATKVEPTKYLAVHYWKCFASVVTQLNRDCSNVLLTQTDIVRRIK